MSLEILDCSTTTNRNSEILFDEICPIVTMNTENVPPQSHSQWMHRNRPNLKKIKISEAAKARENMAEYINERRSVMKEELEMLREKHAEEMMTLKMRREMEQKMSQEKHAKEMMTLEMRREMEQKMFQEKHLEEMKILKMKRENEALKREELKLKIEFCNKN